MSLGIKFLTLIQTSDLNLWYKHSDKSFKSVFYENMLSNCNGFNLKSRSWKGQSNKLALTEH